MIIELTGIPGSGKTTLAKALCERYGYTFVECTEFFMPESLRRPDGRRVVGRMIAELRAASGALCALVSDTDVRRLLRESLALLASNRSAFLDRANILRNTLIKIAAYRALRSRHSGVYIVDEGLTHLPQNLLVDGSDRGSERLQKRLGELLPTIPMPDLIIMLDSSAETASERILKRGHRRFGRRPERIGAILDTARTVSRLSSEGFSRLHAMGGRCILDVPADGIVSGRNRIEAISEAIEDLSCSR